MSHLWGEADRPGWRQVGFDIAVGAFVALVSVAMWSPYGVWALAAGLPLAGAIAVRRVHLPAMLALAAASALVQLVSGRVLIVQDLGFALLFFVLGSHHDRRVRRAGLALAVVGSALAGVRIGTIEFASAGSSIPFAPVQAVAAAAMTALVVGGGWATGLVRWQQRAALQARVAAELDAAERRRLTERVDQAQERSAIAADMHDVVAHSLAVVAAQADGARYTLRTSPDEAADALSVIGETAREAIADLRRILARLRTGDDVEPYTPGIEDRRQLFARMTSSGMRLDVEETGPRRPASLAAAVDHRLLTESLTNALKHGDLDRPVVVRQDWSDGYRLRVRNAVRREDPAASGTGHGIIGMRERVAIAGGELVVRREGDSFVLDAHIPSPASSDTSGPTPREGS